MTHPSVIRQRQEIADNVAKEFAENPAKKPRRCAINIARTFLLRHPEIVGLDGVTYITATKSLGAGVYEIYLKGFKP